MSRTSLIPIKDRPLMDFLVPKSGLHLLFQVQMG